MKPKSIEQKSIVYLDRVRVYQSYRRPQCFHGKAVSLSAGLTGHSQECTSRAPRPSRRNQPRRMYNIENRVAHVTAEHCWLAC